MGNLQHQICGGATHINHTMHSFPFFIFFIFFLLIYLGTFYFFAMAPESGVLQDSDTFSVYVLSDF
jgi:hypothetical protein